MSLLIEYVANGFIVKEYDGCHCTARVIRVIEEPENVTDEEALAEVGSALLWEVIEQFGLYGSKYDAKRVRVTVEPGHCHSDYHAYILKEYGVDMEEGTGYFSLPADPPWWRRLWGWLRGVLP